MLALINITRRQKESLPSIFGFVSPVKNPLVQTLSPDSEQSLDSEQSQEHYVADPFALENIGG
jgi:hypothetical protein